MAKKTGPKLFGKIEPRVHTDMRTEWWPSKVGAFVFDNGPTWGFVARFSEGEIHGRSYATRRAAQLGIERVVARYAADCLALGWEPK